MDRMTFNNTVFANYCFYAMILALKMISMSLLTGFFRIKNKTFSNPEDAAFANTKQRNGDAQVDRVRRAHQNDLENIPVFFIVGLLYALSNPSPTISLWCFRVFTFVRISHTLSYLSGIFPPRVSSYSVGVCVNIFMSLSVLSTYL